MEITKDNREILDEILNSFSCVKDRAIESFLHERAVLFEELSKARTYLICSENQLSEAEFSLRNLNVYGFISVGISILSISDEISNRIRKELDGFSSKKRGTPLSNFPCYLIGQLAKNSNVEDKGISGFQLIEHAIDIIKASVQKVGGRYILVECRRDDNLLDFYKENDFKPMMLLGDDDDVTNMVQLIKKI